jgi:integrase
MAAKPGYLYRRPSGIYVVRICIPARLRAAIGRAEVHISTGQRELTSAKILAFQTLAEWKARLLKLDRMDVLKLEAGSPLLGGSGFLPLDTAAQAIGMTLPALATEAANQGECLHAYADGWHCTIVADVRQVERDFDGSLLLNDALERGEERRLSHQHLIWPDAHAVAAQLAATGSASECHFYLDTERRRAVFVDLPGVGVPAAQVLIHKAALERIRSTLRGRVTPEMLQSAKEATERAQAASPRHKYASMKVSELVAAFMKAKTGDWKADHRQKMETELGAFVELMGDPALGDLDRPAIDRYRDLLRGLPPNTYLARRRLGMHLSLRELAELVASKNMPTMASTTVDAYVRRLSEMFGWAVKCDYLTKNPAQAAAQRRKSIREQDARDAFSPDDLSRIFSADWYKTGQGERTKSGSFRTFRPHYYWLPLLGLYTGARINELSQLYLHDVRQTSAGVWYLDFNLDGTDKIDDDANTDKSLKTVNSKRVVPLHSHVIGLGFVEYVQALLAAGHKRLFPELKLSKQRGYGKAATSWFNERYLGERLGMERNGRKVFHSFRHTFISALNAAEVPEAIVNQFSGHVRGETMSGTRYRKDQNADDLRRYVERIALKGLPEIAPFDVFAGMAALEDGLQAKRATK